MAFLAGGGEGFIVTCINVDEAAPIKHFAAKFVQRQGNKRQNIDHERRILTQLDHKNIVKVLAYEELYLEYSYLPRDGCAQTLYGVVLMELAVMDLHNFMVKNLFRITDCQQRCTQILKLLS